MPKTLAAASFLSKEGIEAEVLDLRVLRPLDTTAILETVSRTRRCVIVDEGWRSDSISAEIGMRVAESAFFELDAPPRRVCGREVPMPYAAHLEDACLPQAESPRRRANSSRHHDRLPHARIGRRYGGPALVEWLVQPGDKVKSGSIIAVVETQKGAIEIEVFAEGTIAEIVVPVGQRVPVGSFLGTVLNFVCDLAQWERRILHGPTQGTENPRRATRPAFGRRGCENSV